MNTIEPTIAERPAAAGRQRNDMDAALLSLIPPLLGAGVGLALVIATGAFLLGRQDAVGAIVAALAGPHSAWYLSRASAFAAYALLWWSMVWGVTISNRMARVWPGGPTAGDLHEHASLLGLGFSVLHALVLLGDSYIGYTPAQILIPFAGDSYRPLWVGVGQISIYLMALVTVTFYMRRWLGRRTWRVIHYASYAAFALALAHGLLSGTDSAAPWAFWSYAGSSAILVGLTVYRVLTARR